MKQSKRNKIDLQKKKNRRERRLRRKNNTAEVTTKKISSTAVSMWEHFLDWSFRNYFSKILIRWSGAPLVMTTISYREIFGNMQNFNVNDALSNIPTKSLLNFVVQRQNSVLYAFSNIQQQHSLFHELWCVLTYVEKKRFAHHYFSLKGGRNFLLFENMSCLVCMAISLRHNVQGDRELTVEDKRNIFKAISFLNSEWSHVPHYKKYSDTSLSLLADLPISEFKLPKHPITQMYKACLFFEFYENSKVYASHLKAFCEDNKVETWQYYVVRLFFLYTKYMNVTSSGIPDQLENFVWQYVVNPEAIPNERTDVVGLLKYNDFIKYLRSHFFVQDGDEFMLINANLLADKIYQGLKFSMFFSALNHGCVDKNGKLVEKFDSYCHDLGEDFSENSLLVNLLDKVYSNDKYCKYSGDQMKDKGVIAPSDYYVRKGDIVFIFEFKDELLADAEKMSGDITKIKNKIAEKICCPKSKRSGAKGVFQLYNTIESFSNKDGIVKIDKDIKSVKSVFPIVVTTDRSFSALGVNQYAWELSQTRKNEVSKNAECQIYDPIIVDYDMLYRLAYSLHSGEIELQDLLTEYDSYVHKKKNRKKKYLHKFTSFNTFILDRYFRFAQGMTSDEFNFHFEGKLDNLIQNENTFLDELSKLESM